jgi:hypothetical protein
MCVHVCEEGGGKMLQVGVQARHHVCYCGFKPHKVLCKGSPPRCRQVECVIGTQVVGLLHELLNRSKGSSKGAGGHRMQQQAAYKCCGAAAPCRAICG